MFLPSSLALTQVKVQENVFDLCSSAALDIRPQLQLLQHETALPQNAYNERSEGCFFSHSDCES